MGKSRVIRGGRQKGSHKFGCMGTEKKRPLPDSKARVYVQEHASLPSFGILFLNIFKRDSF